MFTDLMSAIRQALKKRSIFVDTLAILFGICSWIGVTSVYLQLPLIVSTAPEQWTLASYLVLTVQLGNVGSFVYVIYQKYSSKKVSDDLLIYITLVIGCVAAIGMAFFYQITIDNHSVALLLFSFLLSLVGCVSMVLFMPYMGRFRECYLVSYMLGMALNGFLSSILALIQGVGGPSQCIPIKNSTDGTTKLTEYTPPPVFGTKLYFILVFIIMLIGTVAFHLLNKLNVCKKEYASGTIGSGNDYHYDENAENSEYKETIPDDVRHLSPFNYRFLILTIVSLNVLANGIFPGIVTYVGMPYGNNVYHLCVTLAAIGNPICGLLAAFLPHTSIRVNRILTVTQSILAIYIFYIATQSPSPPLQNSLIGSILIVRVKSIEFRDYCFCYVMSFVINKSFDCYCVFSAIGCSMDNFQLNDKLYENINCLNISLSARTHSGLGGGIHSNWIYHWINC